MILLSAYLCYMERSGQTKDFQILKVDDTSSLLLGKKGLYSNVICLVNFLEGDN